MIDPTKPGPDADRIAELEREIVRAENQVALTPLGLSLLEAHRAELARLSNEQPKGGDVTGLGFTTLPGEEPGQFKPVPSPAPSPEPQDVRGKIAPLALRALERRRFAAEDGRYLLTQSQAFDAFVEVLGAFPALAQSAAQPSIDEDAAHDAFNKWMESTQGGRRSAFFAGIEFALRRADQSDAQPVAREIGPTHVICPNCCHDFRAISQADRAALAQSDARPIGWQFEAAAMAKTLQHWAEALSTESIPKLSVEDIALANGGCITDDLREAARLLTAPHRPDASGLIAAAELRAALVGHDPEMPEPIQPLGWLHSAIHELKDRGPSEECDDPDAFYMMIREIEELLDNARVALRSRAADRSAPRSDRGGASHDH